MHLNAAKVVLFDCALGDDGIECMASALSPSSTVTTILDVAFNSVTDFGAGTTDSNVRFVIIALFKTHLGALYTRLKHHNNNNNNNDNDNNATLRLSTIVLAGNQIGDTVVESLRALNITILRQEKPPSE